MKSAAFLLELTLFQLLIIPSQNALAQGALIPPGGPVPTMKTLDQIESRTPISSVPVFLSTSGSYYLTSNLTGVASLHGIEINADDVCIDLNGFSLIGVPGSSNGVSVSPGHKGITIRNGEIRNWGGFGAKGVDDNVQFLLNDLQLRNNGQSGVYAGYNSVIRRCAAENNGLHGIEVSSTSLIEGCTSHLNSSNGIVLGLGCVVTGSLSANNLGHGISTGSGCLVKDCVAQLNRLDGIVTLSYCSILNNHCYGNGNGGDGAGVHAKSIDNRVEGNYAAQNDLGIQIDLATGNLAIHNTAVGNTSTNFVLALGGSFGPVIPNIAIVTNLSPHANFQP